MVLFCALLVAAASFANAGEVVLFGEKGVVSERSAALAELVPWKAPDAALRLVDEKIEHLGGGAYAVTRTVKNVGGGPVEFKDELRVRDCFPADRYLIPCVNYNGNRFGALKTPKGLSFEGQPWVFSYERTGVPSCTLTENGSTGLAVFAANDTKESLVSACSLELAEGRYEHVIVRPVTEAPYTYESKGVFGPRYDTYVTLGAGETFTAKSYVCVCRPKWTDYAYASLIDHALNLLDPQLKPCLTDDEVFDLGIRYVHALLYLYKGKWLVNEHYVNRMAHDCAAMRISREEMAERMKWEYWTTLGTYCQTFEVGWAGQNFLNARMLAVKALGGPRNAGGPQSPAAAAAQERVPPHDAALLKKAVGVFDAFVATQYPSGLLHTCYQFNFEADRVERRPSDVCNMGWAAAEAVRMNRLLSAHGMGKPEYVKFARGICDFFVAHWSDEWGFGKSWRMDGRPAAQAGTIGGFLIPALVELYDETKERKYLDAALKASDFYFKRDLDRFECTAGAIDCYCIDKETAWPLLNGSLSLHRITGDAKHLERAEKAAAYFTSWMYFFDGVYGPDTDIAKHGWRATGGTAVSAEHHGIDPWGALAVPDLEELSELTGDKKWRRIAGLMWANAMQCITTRLGEFYHGQQRPIGSQSEACFPARFTKYRPVIEAGYFSDILAPWPGAFRMWTVERLHSKGIEMR